MKVSELIGHLLHIIGEDGDMDVVFYTESSRDAKEYYAFNIDICESLDDEDKLDCVITC